MEPNEDMMLRAGTIKHDSPEAEADAGEKLEREIRADRMRRGLLAHPQPEDSFPHGISCACCWEQLICNHCGKGNVRQSTGRCTNGRCTQCCFKLCQHRTS
jgi:hypothetical protein